MKTCNQYAGKLRSVVGYFASLFAMNALEITAWGYLLRLHFHPSDSLADLITILQMTGFHIKSILSHKSVHYLPQLISEDPNFLENYTRWCNDYSLPTGLSLAQVHKTYKELEARMHTIKRPKLLNKAVDEILQVETCEERPRKLRKTEVFQCDPPMTPFKPSLFCTSPLEMPLFSDLAEDFFDVDKYLS